MSFCFVKSLFTEPDASKFPAYHPFKSEKCKQLYLSYYDMRSKQWPVVSEIKNVRTSFGSTFVRISGNHDTPPLVLLPSVHECSLEWIPIIKGLSEHFRTYAIDNVYDIGRSINSCVMRNPQEMVAWLDELFTDLKLDSINITGFSFGGWEAGEYVLIHPERVRKSVLIAPAATVIDLPAEWIWRGILFAIPNKWLMYHATINWAYGDLVKRQDEINKRLVNETLEEEVISLKCFGFQKPISPTVLTDKELKRI